MDTRYLVAILIVLGLVGCQSQEPTEIAVTAGATSTASLVIETATDVPISATNTPIPKPDRVVVLSIPNVAAGMLPSLGDAPQYVIESAELATMAVVHNSLAAGRLPSEIGIVGERVHRPEDGIYWYTSAFELPMQGAEPIWKVGSDQGLTTAALFWPGATPSLPDQMADYTVGYGQRDGYSEQHQVGLYAAGAWVDAPSSYSLMLEGQFNLEGDDAIIATVYMLGIDTSDDGVANADTFILSKDRVVSEDDATLHRNEWARWMLEANSGQGADFLITGIEGSTITLFQSRVYSVLAAPDELKREIIARHGYFAPEPDFFGLNAGWITADQYMDMVRRQSDWMMDVTLWVDQAYQPEMLFTVQNLMAQAGHQFMLVDARQAGYSEERAAEYRGYMEQAAAQADRVVGRVLQQAQVEGTAIMVVSPVGLEPIHTRVNLNIALAEAGLLRLGNRGFVIMPATQAIGFSSGGAAHIYINDTGREDEGIVAPEEVDAVAAQIVELLRGLVDPQTGEAIFAKVVQRDEVESLNGLYAGDVFVQANAGYVIDDETDADAIFGAVSFYGQQGYEHPGLLYLIGGLDVRNDIRLVDIAPSIAVLLGFDMSDADGRSIFVD